MNEDRSLSLWGWERAHVLKVSVSKAGGTKIPRTHVKKLDNSDHVLVTPELGKGGQSGVSLKVID